MITGKVAVVPTEERRVEKKHSIYRKEAVNYVRNILDISTLHYTLDISTIHFYTLDISIIHLFNIQRFLWPVICLMILIPLVLNQSLNKKFVAHKLNDSNFSLSIAFIGYSQTSKSPLLLSTFM